MLIFCRRQFRINDRMLKDKTKTVIFLGMEMEKEIVLKSDNEQLRMFEIYLIEMRGSPLLMYLLCRV